MFGQAFFLVFAQADGEGVPSIGVESHPFVARVARVKIRGGVDADSLRAYALGVLKRAQAIEANVDGYPELIHKCYPDDPLADLDRLRQSWLESRDDPLSEFGWLALAAILRQCSPVGTANWQYVLPKKSKANSSHPFWG